MTFYLSAYRSQPAAAYLFARVRLSRKEIESDLQIGLNVAYVEQESQTVTLYPFEKSYSISDAEWLRWKELQDADAISLENTGICYRFYMYDRFWNIKAFSHVRKCIRKQKLSFFDTRKKFFFFAKFQCFLKQCREERICMKCNFRTVQVAAAKPYSVLKFQLI